MQHFVDIRRDFYFIRSMAPLNMFSAFFMRELSARYSMPLRVIRGVIGYAMCGNLSPNVILYFIPSIYPACCSSIISCSYSRSDIFSASADMQRTSKLSSPLLRSSSFKFLRGVLLARRFSVAWKRGLDFHLQASLNISLQSLPHHVKSGFRHYGGYPWEIPIFPQCVKDAQTGKR